MAKKSNAKNIIVTNLPAAAALLLMAAALKLTLQYSFFLSLVVLVVVYFLLGVTIELIMEKAENKKKRENLFKQFSEGGRSNLPTGRDELYVDEEYELPFINVEGTALDLDMVKKPLEEAPKDDMGFLSDPDGKFDEKTEDNDENISENVIVEEPEAFEENISEEQDEDDFLNVNISDLIKEEESKEEQTSDLDKFFAGAFGDSAVSEVVNEKTVSEVETPMDEASEVDEIQEEEEVSVDDEIIEEVIVDPVTEDAPTDEPVEEQEPEEAVAEELSADDEAEIETEPVSETQSEETEASVEINDDLYDALKEVGAIPEEPVDDTPAAEKEARRSLFEGSDFDADISTAGHHSSVIFGSVPDTEDDIEYIPPVIDNNAAPQKGKVKVDSQKIDDLYAFKKANSGESFFGRRRKK